MPIVSGKQLNERWGIGALHTLYRHDGMLYTVLERFPAALCDANGYVRFESLRDLEACEGLEIDRDHNLLSVPGGIASLAGYVTAPEPARFVGRSGLVAIASPFARVAAFLFGRPPRAAQPEPQPPMADPPSPEPRPDPVRDSTDVEWDFTPGATDAVAGGPAPLPEDDWRSLYRSG